MMRPSVATRRAGFVVPLFSLRGSHDVGVGDILDLVPIIQWAASFGQGIVQLLPITETAPEEASPYSALSAFAIDPLYISIRAVPQAPPVPSFCVKDGSLPRDSIRKAKLQSLATAFSAAGGAEQTGAGQALASFIEANRGWLDDYALYRALAEELGTPCWRRWPASLRDRDPGALARATRRLASRIDVLRYVQWIAAEQWAQMRRGAAALGVWLHGDLPFVSNTDSADVWAHQDEFDLRYSVGAPPDDFSPSGQSWGLPLYNWERIRATDFFWWRQRVRQARSMVDLFRIDHIVGFFRTYAIPNDDGSEGRRFVPADEGAQHEQGESFLGAVLAEAGDALPIAEDLGTVPTWVRALLRRRGIPGYKVLRWEREDQRYVDPRSYDTLSVATTGTHDTETLVDWWAGLDARERQRVLSGLDVPRWCDSAALTPGLRRQLIERLYESGSAFAVLPLQDLFGWRERINVPATPSRNNWNWRLSRPVEELVATPAIQEEMSVLLRLAIATGRARAPA